MRIVDSHCHAVMSWYDPVESLLYQMDRHGVEQAVLIQIRGQTNNDYQFECVRRYPDRLVSVVLIDPSRPDAADELARLHALGARGVRFFPTTRSPGDDPLAIWRKASELGLAVSLLGGVADVGSQEFAELVQALPNLTIVVEHLGGSNVPETESPPYASRQRIFALARFPNACLKIHGLGEFATRRMPVAEPFPFEEPIPPFLAMAYAAFGAERMMWGSDYPPVSSREGYANALRFTLDQFAHVREADRAAIFGGTAARVFGLTR